MIPKSPIIATKLLLLACTSPLAADLKFTLTGLLLLTGGTHGYVDNSVVASWDNSATATYVVETSPTPIGGTWTSTCVSEGTPAPAPDITTTASIPVDAGTAFLRLAVTKNP